MQTTSWRKNLASAEPRICQGSWPNIRIKSRQSLQRYERTVLLQVIKLSQPPLKCVIADSLLFIYINRHETLFSTHWWRTVLILHVFSLLAESRGGSA